jgi:hypothetical protein
LNEALGLPENPETRLQEKALKVPTLPESTINVMLVEFQVHYVAKFGQEVEMAGSIPSLGNWLPSCALKLTWSEGHVWRACLNPDQLSNSKFEFKFIVTCGS